MKILPEPITFDWDKGNAEKNFKKHRLTIQEIEQAFKSEYTFIFEDKKHSQKEKRYGMFTEVSEDKQFSIVFMIRKDKIRIITARPMSKRERREYEKIKNYTNIYK